MPPLGRSFKLDQLQLSSHHPADVAILTGGGDKPYALGTAYALATQGVAFDFIGSDDLRVPEVTGNPFARFLNLRGNQCPDAPPWKKFWRVVLYYLRLLSYAATSRARVLHILWNNKFEHFDRTLLLLFYRSCGKRLVYTAHNVNTRARDGTDSFFNRFTLRHQYHLVHHIFVHTPRMREEIVRTFGVREDKVTVIPFGINETNLRTELSRNEARRLLIIPPGAKAILFFGNIAPYKGLEFLLQAFASLLQEDPSCHLLVAGRNVKCPSEYWRMLQSLMDSPSLCGRITKHVEFIPDDRVEVYFKAADVLVLPYTEIFQSGVLSLGYNFGLPVVAAHVGSLKDEIVEGRTGFVCQPRDPADLVRALKQYFASSLFRNLESNRQSIQDYARDRYSWAKVAKITSSVYSRLLQAPRSSAHISKSSTPE